MLVDGLVEKLWVQFHEGQVISSHMENYNIGLISSCWCLNLAIFFLSLTEPPGNALTVKPTSSIWCGRSLKMESV